ncbi:hypothetical protein TWF718_006410 [Orbilia javanica]|uniref:Amine oxidase n=1 Tax=Orbilia javanica TaxID=47235 RepID=A0AAN8NYE9_9PEZI
MRLLGASRLFLLGLELQLAAGAAIENINQNRKRTVADYDLYLRDLGHDGVPPLDHLLAIRDLSSHIPISNTRITPGMLLEHILDTNPSLKPAKVERMGSYEFNRYSFNESVWNGGVADMLSHAPVKTTVKLSDLNRAAEDQEPPPVHTPAQRKRAVMGQFNSDDAFYDTTKGDPPKPVQQISAAGSYNWEIMKPTYMARCFDEKGKYVYAVLSDLREVADLYCTLFDANMYKLAKGIALNDLGEFSLGTIYNAVKLESGRKMRVNFQFIYQPKGYENGKFWYPLSMFTGIQGVCHRMMQNFLSPETSMAGCMGGSGRDTRGGWMGMDVGPWNDGRMVLRWAIDPYVRLSKEHDYPDPFPVDEVNNGLPRTDPKDIYQP